MTSEVRRRGPSTSRTYGGEDCASFAICSRVGVSGRASSINRLGTLEHGLVVYRVGWLLSV